MHRQRPSTGYAVAIGVTGALVPTGMTFAFGAQAWIEGTPGDAVAVTSFVIATAVTIAGVFVDRASRVHATLSSTQSTEGG